MEIQYGHIWHPSRPADHRHTEYRGRITDIGGPGVAEQCPGGIQRQVHGALGESGRPRLTVYEEIRGSNPAQFANRALAGPPDGDVSSGAEHRAVNAGTSVQFRYVTPLGLEAETWIQRRTENPERVSSTLTQPTTSTPIVQAKNTALRRPRSRCRNRWGYQVLEAELHEAAPSEGAGWRLESARGHHCRLSSSGRAPAL